MKACFHCGNPRSVQGQAENETRASGKPGPASFRVGCCAQRQLWASREAQVSRQRNDHRRWRDVTESGLQARPIEVGGMKDEG